MRDQSHLYSSALLAGAIGIVIVPDQATIDQAYALAAEILPPGAEHVLSIGTLPHVTLYHAKLHGLPVHEAATVLKGIREELQSRTFRLGPIDAFGGNFVFWKLEQDLRSNAILQTAHERALALAKFLDRVAPASAIAEEGLTLSPEQLGNVRLFGHPLVRELYTPHITLGFHRGVAEMLPSGLKRSWSFAVRSVELVRVGSQGRVGEVLDIGEHFDTQESSQK